MPVDVMNCLVAPEMLGKVQMRGNVIIATQMTTMIAASQVIELNKKKEEIEMNMRCGRAVWELDKIRSVSDP
jgi:hypothetical protein